MFWLNMNIISPKGNEYRYMGNGRWAPDKDIKHLFKMFLKINKAASKTVMMSKHRDFIEAIINLFFIKKLCGVELANLYGRWMNPYTAGKVEMIEGNLLMNFNFSTSKTKTCILYVHFCQH
jgi:hypothetical protein